MKIMTGNQNAGLVYSRGFLFAGIASAGKSIRFKQILPVGESFSVSPVSYYIHREIPFNAPVEKGQ
ncbi:hypothetical protein [Dyadobacter psychrotolerans]|uniref:Uncharacterized protein n=1 Tax=Dyadobacter psychrotolerans TaxID=2541721 RepID=A0A4R5D4F7_9BACT|nr:hypothetical protein [Dyadobacter psychrotolerans]TDE08289.1 hypothetical protein E0F88_32840 [Dyadobacter psychrotolerans]